MLTCLKTLVVKYQTTVRAVHTLTLCLLTAPSLTSQTATESKLPRANAQLSEDFVGIHTGRELADGRLLIGEGTRESRRLLVIDFAQGTSRQIGRRGSGPGEYQTVSTLYPLAGDSTLLSADLGRWLILSGSQIVNTVTGNDPPVRIALPLSGADSIGNVLSFDRKSVLPESTSRILVSRRTGNSTSVARLRSNTEAGYPPKPASRASGSIDYFNGPWNSYELATLFPDGWLAVARVQPYRVDWRTPDGRWIFGKPIPVPVVRVNNREKIEFMKRSAGRAGTSPQPPTVHSLWPKEIPPFLPGAPIAGSDGRLFILRTPTADHPAVRYDIIDRQGRLGQQLVLEQNARIVAFGQRSVFVVATDSDGLERLQRHPWPK